MPMEKNIKVTRYRCDHPTCLDYQLVEADEYPIGLVGQVREHTGSGGTGQVPWFACSREHVQEAIENALKEHWGS